MYQETLVILKPDALERNLIGVCIKRFENNGLKVLDLKYYKKIDETILKQHYPDTMALSVGKKAQVASPEIIDPLTHGFKVLERLRKYFTRNPVLVVRIGGEEAVSEVRKITGYTDPATAEKGSIRGDYGLDTIAKSTAEGRACENLIHASGNLDEAKTELALWFKK